MSEIAYEDPIFCGLFDRTITSIPPNVSKPAPEPIQLATNPGRWIEMPRMPIPTAEMGVIECEGKVHVIGGYARQNVNSAYHQVYDPVLKTWSLKAPIPFANNHLSLAVIGSLIYSFGGFTEQNRCPHSKCFVYDAKSDEWAPLPNLIRPRGAISAVALDGLIHLLGGRDIRSLDWHEVYDPKTQKFKILEGMRGSTPTQPFAGQRCHMGAVVIDGKIHTVGGRKDFVRFQHLAPFGLRSEVGLCGHSGVLCRPRAVAYAPLMFRAGSSRSAVKRPVSSLPRTRDTIQRRTGGSCWLRCQFRVTDCMVRRRLSSAPMSMCRAARP